MTIISTIIYLLMTIFKSSSRSRNIMLPLATYLWEYVDKQNS